jgi:hypothetical protein
MGKATEPRLSLHLLAEARGFLGYPTRLYRTQENLRFQKQVFDRIVQDLITQHETFMTSPPLDHSLDSEKLAGRYDENYCRSLLADVPDIVARTLRLKEVNLTAVPKGELWTYIREASRTYAMGFFTASVALSRSALEAAVRPRAARYLGATAADEMELKELIDRGQIADKRVRDLAHRVRTTGNRVLHGNKPATAEETLTVIEAVREVVVYLGRA